MLKIRYVQPEDKEFWYSLDKHLPEPEFALEGTIKTVLNALPTLIAKKGI